jgi:hypothetical protein
MKQVIWLVFVVVFLGWTVTAWVSAELSQWLLSTMGAQANGSVVQAVGQWPMPAWLAVWVSPALIESLQAAWLDITGWIAPWLPSAEGLSGVVTALVWIAWGLGALSLTALALFLHWIAGKVARPASWS